LAVSLSRPDEVLAGRVTFFPRGLNFTGYEYILQDGQLFIGYRNTIAYAAVGTLLTLTFTSMAAYSLSRKDLIFRKFFTLYWALTMFFSGGLIPSYLNIRNLGMMDTFWVMVVPGCISGYTMFVFRSFIGELPTELREAAYVDGAGEFRIWRSVIIPLSKPLLATYALFTIVAHWNSWFGAMLYLKSAERYPLQLYLRRLVVLNDLSGGSYYADTASAELMSGAMTPQNAQMAAIVLTLIPILCIYPYIQRFFVKGVMIGSIKG